MTLLDNTFAQVCSLLVQLQLLPASRRGGVRDRGRLRRRLPRRHRSTRLVKVQEAYTLSGILAYPDLVYPYHLVYPYLVSIMFLCVCNLFIPPGARSRHRLTKADSAQC